jgi:hypothetical protein
LVSRTYGANIGVDRFTTGGAAFVPWQRWVETWKFIQKPAREPSFEEVVNHHVLEGLGVKEFRAILVRAEENGFGYLRRFQLAGHLRRHSREELL